MEQTKTKIVTLDFVLLFLVSTALCTGMNMLNVICPLFVIEDLGRTTAASGLLSAVYTLSSCAARPASGVLSDRMGRRVMMAVGCAVFAAGCLLCGLIPTLAILLMGRIFQGMGYAVASTANNAASTDVIPQSRMAEGIGYFGTSQSVAGALGPALASVLVDLVGNRLSFYVAGAFCLLAALLSLFFRRPHTPPPPREKRRAGLSLDALAERTALLPSAFEGLSVFFFSGIMCFFTPYLKVERGFDAWVAGSFFAVSAVVIVLFRLGFSRFVGRVSHLWFLLPAYAAMLVLCLSAPYSNSAFPFLALGALFGLGHGSVWTAMGSAAVEHAPPERRGMANATFYLAFDAAIGLGAALWGVVISAVGYVLCFRIMAAGFVLLALAAIPVFRKKAA